MVVSHSPSPSPAVGGGSGGGSGGSAPAAVPTPAPTPTPDPIDVTGHVVASLPEGEGGPVAGARVTAYSGATPIEATTDAAGAFSLAGFIPGSPLLVTAPGHLPSVVAGWAGEPETLHLAAGSPLAGRWEQFLAVSGVVTLDGAPVAGAVVVGGNGRGTAFGPLVTGADGRFGGVATSYEGTAATGVAAIAFQAEPYAHATTLGASTGGAIGEGAGPMAIALSRPVDAVRLQVKEAPEGTRRAAGIDARAANGLQVQLASWGPTDELDPAPVFAVPGLEQVARIEVASPDGLARSAWRRSLTGAVDDSKVLPARLLPFPPQVAIGPAQVAEGQTIAWPATAGATGYRVSVHQAEGAAATWEAFTPHPALTFHGLPAGAPASLEVTAQEGAGAAHYRLAGIAPPRRLRWFDAGALERYSTRTFPLHP